MRRNKIIRPNERARITPSKRRKLRKNMLVRRLIKTVQK